MGLTRKFSHIDFEQVMYFSSPGNLILIAGRPFMHKTSFVLEYAEYLTQNGHNAMAFLDAQHIALDKICSKIRERVSNDGIEYFFIDCLPYIDMDDGNQRLTHIFTMLHTIAKETNVIIYVVYPLPPRMDDTIAIVPQLNQYPEVQKIASFFETILFVHRPEYYAQLFDELGYCLRYRTLILFATK